MLGHGFKKVMWYEKDQSFIFCSTQDDFNKLYRKYGRYWGTDLKDISLYDIRDDSLETLRMVYPTLNAQSLIRCVETFNSLSHPSAPAWGAEIDNDGSVFCVPLQ